MYIEYWIYLISDLYLDFQNYSNGENGENKEWRES